MLHTVRSGSYVQYQRQRPVYVVRQTANTQHTPLQKYDTYELYSIMASAFGKAASLVMGTSAFAGSLYMSYNIKRMELQFQERHKQQHLPADYSFVATPERNKQYEQVAKCYDKSIGREELVSGIIWMRDAF